MSAQTVDPQARYHRRSRLPIDKSWHRPRIALGSPAAVARALAKHYDTAQLSQIASLTGKARSEMTTQTAAAAVPILATELQLLHAPGLTSGQREARRYLAAAIADLRYALATPGAGPDIAASAQQLLDAMAGADDADARAARSPR